MGSRAGDPLAHRVPPRVTRAATPRGALTSRSMANMIGRPSNKDGGRPMMPQTMTSVNGEPLSPESLRMLDYLRERAAALDPGQINGRVRAAMSELDQALKEVGE